MTVYEALSLIVQFQIATITMISLIVMIVYKNKKK